MKSERGLIHLLIAGEIVVLILMILLGLVKQIKGSEEPENYMVSTQNNLIETTSTDTGETEAATDTEEPAGIFSEEIEALLAEMTTEQKVAQLFFVSPEALTGKNRVTIAGEGTRSALADYPVGGFLYARTNYRSQEQMMELLNGAQTMSYEQSGRYLFTGVLLETEEETVLVTGQNGDEELLAQFVGANEAVEDADLEALMQISLSEEAEQFDVEQIEAPLACYLVGEEIPLAVVAIQNGADMLCVTEHFTEVYDSVLAAAMTQAIPEEVIDRAVGRILTEKTEHGR